MSSLERLSRKEIKDLQRERTKAQERGNLLEEAKLCNKLGDLFARCGEYGKAIDEHKAELQLSTLLDLPTDSGIAHRKLGECLCELGQFREALQHQQQHLHLAQSTGDVQEQQRAYATIGRTWFVWSQEYVHQTAETQTRLNNAEKAYLMSQEMCNKLEGIVSNREWLTMKGRLFLNLGLVHESQTDKRNSRKAKKFLECALKLSRENGDYETEYRSQLSLASSFMHNNMTSYALRCYESAIQIAKQQKSTKLEAEAHEGMGQAFVMIGNFKASKMHFSMSFKLGLYSPTEQHMLGVNLKRVRKAVRLEKLLNRSPRNMNKEEMVKKWEKLGDLCAGLRTYNKAVSCYEKQLSLSHELGWEGDKIAPVLISLARTLADSQQYHQAIQYYKMEIEAREGNPLEQCNSWCCIARAHADAGHSFEDVISAYLAALQCAKDANSLSQQCVITKKLLTLYDMEGNMVKTEELKQQLRNLEKECQTAGEWSQETGETSDATDNNASEDEESSDGKWTSDDSDGSDEENPLRRSKQSNVMKIDKVNTKGETLLHQSCITGNISQVQSLLAEGATVHTRDYCGWTPLHEACNHGYTEIAHLLLLNGANVNDPGGHGCQGITPVHDAAINGHLEVVKVLIEFGADLSIRNAQGMTPLDWVKDQIDSDDEDDDDNDSQDRAGGNRRAVCDYLAERMKEMHFLNKRSRERVGGECLGYNDSDKTPSPHPNQDHAARAEKAVRRWRNRHRSRTNNHCLDGESDSMEVDREQGELIGNNDSNPMEDHQDDVIQGGFEGKQHETSPSKEVQPVSESELPCALVPESDYNNQERMTLDDWLIDDMGPAVKRRRTDKTASPRSPHQRHHRQSEVTINGQRSVVTNNSRSPVDRLSNSRQRTAGSDNSMISDPPSITNVSLPMRVHVSVLGKAFVIPCPNTENDGSAHGPKLEWVAGEAASRYYSMTGLRPRLLLKTQEGALFDPNDCVETVLANKEELQGYVESWDLPPLSERYLKACNSAGQDACPFLFDVVECDSNPSEISLQDQLICTETFIPFFRALQCQLSLTRLQLAGNQIGNSGFIQLGVSLRTLPNVTLLDVSLNDITVEGLNGFVEQLTSKSGDEVDVASSVGQPLSRLCDLNLSYNSLGDDIGSALTKLLAQCVSLSSLALDACKLTSGFKTGEWMADKQGVLNISVAHNHLGGVGVQSLLHTVSSACLKHINLSYCRCNHDNFATNIAAVFLAKCPLQLETVILSGCALTDVDCTTMEPFLSSCPLHQLTLSVNKLDSKSASSLVRVVNSCQSLKVLSIAGNPGFGNDGLRMLLPVAAQLQVLDVSACGIVSPLPDDVARLHPLSHIHSVNLHHLLLSGNRLHESDRDIMTKSWQALWNNKAKCCLSNNAHFTLASTEPV